MSSTVITGQFLPPGPARRTFPSTEHLSLEAVAAYVDGEMPLTPYLRASTHLSHCPECRDQIQAQMQARAALRNSSSVGAPESLLTMLSQIPSSDARCDGPGFPLASPSPHRKQRKRQ
ncbi:zf-HC2 domain-containing protein [Hoyosella rhizosphaerae]|nr:zf-HC2 domain-containing protein [Hoyosella rhizosphaerae]